MIYYYVSILFLFTLYYFGTCTHGYWKKKGVKHDSTFPIFGNNFWQYVQRSSPAMMAEEIYKKYPKEKVVGFFRGIIPELVVRDPEIIKRILTTDFQHFYARGLTLHKTVVEPLLKNLFFADGDLWRLLRQKFSPAFSSGKLKAMFPIITERAEKLQIVCEEMEDQVVDFRELMARFTTDFIGVCGFGIDMNCLNNDTSQFRKLGKRIFQRTPREAFVFLLKTLFPDLCKHMHLLAPEIENSMVHLVQNVMKERNYKSSGKGDFIDLLLDIRSQGSIVGESVEKKNPDGSPKIVALEITDMILIAQVFVFFGAGFETSSSTSSYTLHQLAFNPEYKEKVHKEIDTVLANHNNKITYEAIKEMHYLELAFLEAMRMYPSVGSLVRTCTSPEYTIPEIGLTINEGLRVIVPLKALHNDENYFSNPKKIDPERFSPERNEAKNFVYMPFGEGPRACVGERLGKMQSMAGIVAVLQKFTVEPAASSVRIPRPDPTAIVAENFLGGLPLKLIKRRQTETA